MDENSVLPFTVSQMPREVQAHIPKLKISVEKNKVRLEGVASSFYFKQLAQEAILKALPKMELENKIQVKH